MKFCQRHASPLRVSAAGDDFHAAPHSSCGLNSHAWLLLHSDLWAAPEKRNRPPRPVFRSFVVELQTEKDSMAERGGFEPPIWTQPRSQAARSTKGAEAGCIRIYGLCEELCDLLRAMMESARLVLIGTTASKAREGSPGLQDAGPTGYPSPIKRLSNHDKTVFSLTTLEPELNGFQADPAEATEIAAGR